MDNTNEIEILKMLRKKIFITGYKGGMAHLASCFSSIEMIYALYAKNILRYDRNNAKWEDRDRFILSKGHGVLAFYSALAEFGIIDNALIETFMDNGSDLIAHPVMKPSIGIEASTGSLGQGISIAVGMALAAKKKGYSYKTYVLCGNGECNEGSVWEAFMSAVNYKLDNLTVFIDNNHFQSDGISEKIMNVSNCYAGMLQALGFQVIETDGNSIAEVYDAFMLPHEEGKPKVLIGNTIKGKGISFMENNNDWHHNRLTKEQLDDALNELEKM